MAAASATDIRVLSQGSDTSALKVLSIRAKDDPYYLRIDVFREDLEKPFVAYKASEIFVGACKGI